VLKQKNRAYIISLCWDIWVFCKYISDQRNQRLRNSVKL